MRSREEDRARWEDPEFNKWLDDAISDCGHTVWDSIPDIGSAWNGWDAAKSALGYYCPSCSGSGEEIHTTYHGPDSFERLGHCSTCNGDGRTSVALAVAIGRLEASESMHGLYTSTVTVERAELEQTKRERDQLKAENEALRKDAERMEKATSFVKNLCYCAGEQPSVATGYLHDILSVMSKDEAQ